jgi:lysyl-tRNA synthetase class 1
MALGVDYEMHGKDLLDSVAVSEKVIRCIGGRRPITYKYELFHDEKGRKISKKIGNGVSMDEWLRYAPLDALRYFLYVSPQKTQNMGLSLIPGSIDDYLKALRRHDDTALEAPMFTIRRIEERCPEAVEVPAAQIDYALILNLVRALSTEDEDLVMEYLVGYDPAVSENRDLFSELVAEAVLFNSEVADSAKVDSFELSAEQRDALDLLRSRLADLPAAECSAEDVQTLCYELAKERDLDMRDWFKCLYLVLLSQESGPRIGAFIRLYGIDKVTARISEYLSTGTGP